MKIVAIKKVRTLRTAFHGLVLRMTKEHLTIGRPRRITTDDGNTWQDKETVVGDPDDFRTGQEVEVGGVVKDEDGDASYVRFLTYIHNGRGARAVFVGRAA